MKTLNKCIIGLIAVIWIALPKTVSGATTYIFGLSRCTPNYATNVFGIITDAVISKIAAGDHVVIYNASQLEPVVSFTIAPDRSSKINPRERAIRYASEIGALKSFLLGSNVKGDGYTDMQITKFVVLAGAQLRKPGTEAQIVCIGRLWGFDKDNLSLSLALGVPSDATITAEPDQSPYSTKYRRNVLRAAAVHCAFIEDDWRNDYHREGIERFLTLYISSMGGSLATFAANSQLATDRALSGVSHPCMRAEIDPSDTKIEIRRVHHLPVHRKVHSTNRVEVISEEHSVPQTVIDLTHAPKAAGFAVNEPATPATGMVSEPEPVHRIELETAPDIREKTDAKPTQQEIPAPDRVVPDDKGKTVRPAVTITASWGGKADIDLIVEAIDGTWWLSHRRPSGKQGRYVSSSETLSHYEYVELFESTDLRSIRAFVNLHRGYGDPIIGSVAVTIGGVTHQAQFRFLSSRGDKGRDWPNRSKSKDWIELDLLRIAGIVGPVPLTFRSPQ